MVMLQEIIVYFILAITVGLVIYSIVRRFRHKSSPCDGCSGCDLKNTVAKGEKPSCGCGS
jgi:hypothetical protein